MYKIHKYSYITFIYKDIYINIYTNIGTCMASSASMTAHWITRTASWTAVSNPNDLPPACVSQSSQSSVNPVTRLASHLSIQSPDLPVICQSSHETSQSSVSPVTSLASQAASQTSQSARHQSSKSKQSFSEAGITGDAIYEEGSYSRLIDFCISQL